MNIGEANGINLNYPIIYKQIGGMYSIMYGMSEQCA